jgi:hypothetical protein
MGSTRGASGLSDASSRRALDPVPDGPAVKADIKENFS